MILLIDGVDRTGVISQKSGAIHYADDLGARSRFSVVLNDPTNALVVDVGESVRFTDDLGGVPFGGTVEAATMEILTARGAAMDLQTIHLDCVSYDQLLDRRLVAASYTDPANAGDIVRDIIATVLAADGVTDDYVDDGPALAPGVYTFNYVTATSALDQLGKLTGMTSWVDADRKMHFQERSATAAPFSITDANLTYSSLTRQRTRERYRNIQYVRAGHDLTSSRPESFVGDGKVKSFLLAFPVGLVPSVTVNAVSKTVGILGVETGKDWYWNKDSNVISQDDGATALTAVDTLVVTYQGLFPILVQARNDTEIAARAAVEGGSGIYESKEDDTDLQSGDVALATAIARLAELGYIEEQLTITLRTTGLRAGMLLPLALATEGINGEYLITSVQATCEFGSTFTYIATAVSGNGVGGWMDYFRRQAELGAIQVSSDNEALLLLRQITEALTCGDVLDVAGGMPESRVGIAMVDFAEVA